jgi:hypothetical protein
MTVADLVEKINGKVWQHGRENIRMLHRGLSKPNMLAMGWKAKNLGRTSDLSDVGYRVKDREAFTMMTRTLAGISRQLQDWPQVLQRQRIFCAGRMVISVWRYWAWGPYELSRWTWQVTSVEPPAPATRSSPVFWEHCAVTYPFLSTFILTVLSVGTSLSSYQNPTKHSNVKFIPTQIQEGKKQQMQLK